MDVHADPAAVGCKVHVKPMLYLTDQTAIHVATITAQVVCATVAPHAFAGHKIYGGAADAVLRFPFYRQLLSALGLVPASEANLKQLLRGGNSVVLIPGGIAEMYVGKPDREVLVLSSRRGFARIAVEEGVKIIPVWHFGNSQLLRITAPRCVLDLN